jgi:hypothetical protein
VTLDELDASFVSVDGRRVAVQFRCPGCRGERIVIPFANPPDGGAPAAEMNARGVVWTREGDTLETLTLTPSVDFKHVAFSGPPPYTPRPCNWHGWIRGGSAVSV